MKQTNIIKFVRFISVIVFTAVLFKTGSLYSVEKKFVDIFQIASVEKARELLVKEDETTKRWSRFDIELRLKKKNGTKQEVMKFVADQVLEWSVAEKEKVNSAINEISENIKKQGFKIPLPETVYIIKTTCAEEAGLGLAYTRQNYIVMSEKELQKKYEHVRKVIIHELFHIISRNDPELRKKMYKIIGFNMCNEISHPAEIADRRMTNPDCPVSDSYISLSKDGKNTDYSMMYYANRNYEGGNPFGYITIGFMAVTGDEVKKHLLVEGKPVFYEFSTKTTEIDLGNFFKQVGENADPTNPEEILAENFVFAINNTKGLNSQWVVDQMQEKLRY